MSWKTETLPKNIHDDMHRHAQQPFFRVIGHSRRFAWSWGRRGRHQTWVVRSMSQQVKNSTSEKQCVTSTSQWQDKTRTGHEQNKTKQSMTGHANMVNDNMHTHTCVQSTAAVLFSSPSAFALMGPRLRFDTFMAFKATRCKRRCQIWLRHS